MIYGVDSTEIACDSKMPLYVVEVGDKKVGIYNDIDYDCGARRNKRDKSKYVIEYRLCTLKAINPTIGHSFPLISLLGPVSQKIVKAWIMQEFGVNKHYQPEALLQ